jgi:cytochrome c-type biogenesis protein CcmF
VLQRRLLPSAIVGVAAMLFTVVVWTRDWTTVVAFGLAAFTLAAITRETVVAVRARRRSDRVGWGRALGRTYAGNPRRYGGLVVHTGVVAIAIVLAAGGSFGTKQEVRLTRGQQASVGGYDISYVGRRVTRSDQKNVVAVDLRVVHGGDHLGTYAPAISTFPNSTEGIGTPSVHTGLLEDLYLTLVSSPNQRGRITVGVQTQPMTLWLWIGGGLMALGTLIALAPRVRRRVSVERVVIPPPTADGAGEADAGADGDRPDPIGAGAPV